MYLGKGEFVNLARQEMIVRGSDPEAIAALESSMLAFQINLGYRQEAIADIDSNVENGEINALSFCPNQSALFSSSDSNILYWTF